MKKSGRKATPQRNRRLGSKTAPASSMRNDLIQHALQNGRNVDAEECFLPLLLLLGLWGGARGMRGGFGNFGGGFGAKSPWGAGNPGAMGGFGGWPGAGQMFGMGPYSGMTPGDPTTGFGGGGSWGGAGRRWPFMF